VRRVVLLAVMLLAALPAVASAFVPGDASLGSPFPCPDPSVVAHRAGAYRYYLACTSDYDRNIFPIRGSNDLHHWRLIGYMWSRGGHPAWAEPAGIGRYWAPDITYIGHRWVVYYAAQSATVGFSIGVAWSSQPTGPWHTKLLHYRGQYNHLGGEQETYGGVIDPGEAQDPDTGQRYLVWSEQHSSVWGAKLSQGGLQLDPRVHQLFWVWPGYDCENGSCTVEGSALTFHMHRPYLFTSVASTWDASYAVAAASTRNPLGAYHLVSKTPALRSGNGWLGPGGSQDPVTAPDGRQILFYHASRVINVRHTSNLRLLLAGVLHWIHGGTVPIVGDGLPG
jgi:beta-xylosidase